MAFFSGVMFTKPPVGNRAVPCHIKCDSMTGKAEVIQALRAERGQAFVLSRKRACKRWKTAPRAGWLCVPNRLTPIATGS